MKYAHAFSALQRSFLQQAYELTNKPLFSLAILEVH